MTTHTVKSKEPTVLHGQSHHALIGPDLMAGFKVDTSHVIPGLIEIDRFNDALARTLSVFPLYTGRIQRPRSKQEPWQVRLTNDGVPVTIMSNDSQTEVPLNTVIQSPWTLTRGVDITKYIDYDSNEPVLRVTIVQFTTTGSTSIGLSASHMIGDGFTVLQFLRLLSQNYQGLEPLDPPPSYERAPEYPFNPDAYGDIPVPEFAHSYPLRSIPPYLEPGRKKPGRVNIRMTASQIAQVQKGVVAQCSDGKPPIISRQDALVALLAHCVSKSDPETSPIQHISTIVMNRGIPPRSATAMGNCLMWAMTDAAEDPHKETPYTIAVRVRKALVRLRDPGYAAAYEAKLSRLAREMLDAELAQDFITRSGNMVINSTWRFDWTSAHFGFPGKTRFYHSLLDEPRYVKMFQPNPTLLSDGAWQTHPGDIEISFYVHHEIKPAFVESFTSEARGLGVQGDIEFC